MSNEYAKVVTVQEVGYVITIHYDGNGTDIHNDNIDVFVDFADAKHRYGATYFTLENIRTLMTRYEHTGELNYGQYFSCPDLIIAKDLSVQTIQESIAHLMSTKEFTRAFKRYGDAE